VIKYMSIEEQVDADFTRARQRAFLHRMKARLCGDPSSHQPAFLRGGQEGARRLQRGPPWSEGCAGG
jgi:hypothetical protein